MKTKNKAIIIFGPPGAGKGTQAKLISQRLGYMNFDTGRLIEGIVYNPNLKKNKVVSRERKNFETGKLCTPSWILKISKEAILTIGRAGLGVVFSGSPRTLYEAFGDKRTKCFIAAPEEIYTKKNTIIFEIKIPPSESISRNSVRSICSVCDSPILGFARHLKQCPLCGGSLKKRSLDKPAIIKIRLKEYKERTEPIFKALRKKGFQIHLIDGRPWPVKVFKKIETIVLK